VKVGIRVFARSSKPLGGIASIHLANPGFIQSLPPALCKPAGAQNTGLPADIKIQIDAEQMLATCVQTYLNDFAKPEVQRLRLCRLRTYHHSRDPYVLPTIEFCNALTRLDDDHAHLELNFEDRKMFYDLPKMVNAPLHLNLATRLEHTHIIGGTGHGKTQLLQLMIYKDLLQAAEGNDSVVVIDSQGDLIRTISHLELFNPNREESLRTNLYW
jgi:hypothetical protein